MMNEKIAMTRCEFCESLINDKGCKMCGELLKPRPIGEVDADECPLGIEVDEITSLDAKAKENKIKHGAKADKEKKPRAPRPKDVGKENLVSEIAKAVAELVENCAVINPNNEIGFDFNGDNYSLKLVKHRKPKK